MTRRLLLVDDDRVFASTMARSMARKQVQVDAAYTKAEAMELAARHVYTDITLDLNLGEESGLLLIEGLRALQPHANFLVLTGYASIATTVQAIKLGADNYLAKPVDAAAILKALDQDVESAGPTGEQADDFQPMSVSRLEWEHIQRVLHEHDGNVSATARALNMHRRTLQRKLAKKPVAK